MNREVYGIRTHVMAMKVRLEPVVTHKDYEGNCTHKKSRNGDEREGERVLRKGKLYIHSVKGPDNGRDSEENSEGSKKFDNPVKVIGHHG